MGLPLGGCLDAKSGWRTKIGKQKNNKLLSCKVQFPLDSYDFLMLAHLAPDTHDAVRFLRIEESGLLLTEVKQTRRNSDSDFARTVLMNLDETMMKR